MSKYIQKSSTQFLSMMLPLLLLAGCAKVDPKIAVGERIQNFEVVQLSGTRENFSALSKDQVALVVFWATWCPRCREEVPDINELTAQYGPSLLVIGISAGESLQTVKAHAAGLGIRYPVVVTELSNFAKLGIDSIPRLLLLDSNGQIQQIENGVHASLQASIQRLVREEDAADN